MGRGGKKKKKRKLGFVIEPSSKALIEMSYFVICHLQELGVDISGTLPFLVVQELVVTAISTNSCEAQRGVGGAERRAVCEMLQSHC